jgi:ubiquinone/menaquinone biosynthesis C-methylase UbiE
VAVDDVSDYYASGVELERLTAGGSRIEFERTKDLLERHLPSPPASVLDVGGGPGAYAAWLAERGYDVRLIDPVPMHVEEATRRAESSPRTFTADLGDARQLDAADGSFDIVLLMGPLYHLVERRDRLHALAEARRVLRDGGRVIGTAISRFASLLDGLRQGYLSDPRFEAIVEGDLLDGLHRNPTGELDYFTTSFFHHPDELREEIAEAGLELEGVFGVEGPGWLLWELWDQPDGRANILRVARDVEREPAMLGASAHLLAVGRRSHGS